MMKIDLDDYLQSNSKVHHSQRQKQYASNNRINNKLKMHLNIRAESCLSIQTYDRNIHSSPGKEIEQNYQSIKEDKSLRTTAKSAFGAYNKIINISQAQNDNRMFHTFNGNWSHEPYTSYKGSMMYNTLGIKKKAILSAKMRSQSDLNSPIKQSKEDFIRDKIDFTKQPKPPGVFPVRKRTALSRNSSRSSNFIQKYITHNNESELKQQIFKKIMRNQSQMKNANSYSRSPLVKKSIKKADKEVGISIFSNASIFKCEDINLVKGLRLKL